MGMVDLGRGGEVSIGTTCLPAGRHLLGFSSRRRQEGCRIPSVCWLMATILMSSRTRIRQILANHLWVRHLFKGQGIH